MPFAQSQLDKSPGIAVPVVDKHATLAVLGGDAQ